MTCASFSCWGISPNCVLYTNRNTQACIVSVITNSRTNTQRDGKVVCLWDVWTTLYAPGKLVCLWDVCTTLYAPQERFCLHLCHSIFMSSFYLPEYLSYIFYDIIGRVMCVVTFEYFFFGDRNRIIKNTDEFLFLWRKIPSWSLAEKPAWKMEIFF
jgi:hypothetical protein